MYKQMEVEPLTDLLKTLETSLTTLLGKVSNDPWSLLMFQTLLWSFRRWAIHYLTSDETNGPMNDYVWDTQIHLVRQFAPDGLKEFGIVWLNPLNVGDRTDLLEELNAYCMFIVDVLDKALQDDNEDDQNSLSIFLDDTITDIMDQWLEGRQQYRIYPRPDESVDVFPSERVFTIMRLILDTTVQAREAVAPVQAPEAKVEPKVEPKAEPEPEPKPEPEPEPEPEPKPEPKAEPEPDPEEFLRQQHMQHMHAAVAPTAHTTVQESTIKAAILRRRRTMRVHGKRMEGARATNAKTRKQSSHSFARVG